MTRGVALIVLLALLGCNGAHPPPDSRNDMARRAAKPRTDADPVAASLEVRAGTIRAGEAFALTVVLDIADGYEIQHLHAPPPAIATKLELKLPAGFQAVGEWQMPATVRSQWPDGHPVYAGEATFTRQVRVTNDVKPGNYELTCAIRYQACNDRYCLRPTKHDLMVTTAVASPPAASRR